MGVALGRSVRFGADDATEFRRITSNGSRPTLGIRAYTSTFTP